MSGYKKQHFIPCSYLKFFSATGSWDQGRKTPIFFTDGDRSLATTVDQVGAETYAYSKKNPEFDKQFHRMEEHYPALMERILDGDRKFGASDYFGLLTIMVDFNLRNVAYENRSEEERMEVYQAISRRFNADLFAEVGGGTDMRAMLEHLSNHWRLHVIRPETEEKFITSDNPSTIFVNPKHHRPVMVYLPTHPKIALVAYDRRDLRPTGSEISDDALGVLNGLQVHRCVRHTFSDHDLSEDADAWEKVKSLANRDKPDRWVDGEKWKPDFPSIESNAFNRFTFVERRLDQVNPIAEAVRNAINK